MRATCAPRGGRRYRRSRLTAAGAGLAAAAMACLSLAACGDGAATATAASTSSADSTGSTSSADSTAGPCPSGQAGSAQTGFAQVCLAAGDPRAEKVLSALQSAKRQYKQQAMVFGVWDNGKAVATGALGTSYPQVPATGDMHFRIGNITESMTCTLLLELVDKGKISLDDPVSKWLPGLPNGKRVTVGMLAQSTSGYASFYTPAFDKQFEADPFRTWTPDELIKTSTDQPLDFAPGTKWKFSDSNYMMLGQVLAKAGKAPLPALVKKYILSPLGLKETQMTPTSYIPSPVLHGYDAERGDYEDTTFWSVSWATGIGDMTSDLSDLGTWAAALGTGELLSAKSRARQFAPVTVRTGPFTSKKLYAAMGAIEANGWVVCNPNVPGYYDALAYSPAKKLTVIISSVPGAGSPAGVHYAMAELNRLTAVLDPASPTSVPTRG